MKKIILLFYAVLSLFQLTAQNIDTLNQEVAPIGGLNNLAVHYYGIEFSKKQRTILKDVEIEFIFQVDEKGVPHLSEVNGVIDEAIIDSLKNRTTHINHFYPRIKNGIPEPSIYFMQLVFPTYKLNKHRYGMLEAQAYNEAKLTDFEYIHKAPQRLDLFFGGLVNQFTGLPSNYLGTGGGMKIDISLTDKKRWIYGLNMSFYGNKLKQAYPLNTTRKQFSTPPTLLVGAIFGKWFNKVNVQAEINIAVQNVNEKLGDNDPDWIQLKGWSPGLVINYPFKVGRDNPMYYYGAPSIFNNNLNIHLGIRPIFLAIKEATGVMVEMGFGYRMSVHQVQSYKLKDSYFSR